MALRSSLRGCLYDLVIDNAVASRARPIDQGIVVFAARRVVDSLLTADLVRKMLSG